MQKNLERIILLKLELGTLLENFVSNNINVDLPQKGKVVSFLCLMQCNISLNFH